MVPAVVTFDLFSALIDSRTGGSALFDAVARERGWPVGGARLYSEWDARNKAAQRDCTEWASFAELSRRALAGTYQALGLDGDADADAARVLESVAAWPLWPDVAEGLARLGARYPIGILSNVDDAVLRRTRAAPLVDPGRLLTSERLGAYKPHADIYLRAEQRFSPLVHVATSARDVQGAQQAGIAMIHLRRPGHEPAADAPAARHVAATMGEVADRLAEIAGA